MNKWLSIAASAALVLTLSGCSDDDNNTTNEVVEETPEAVFNLDRPDFGKLKENELYISSLKYFGFDGANVAHTLQRLDPNILTSFFSA